MAGTVTETERKFLDRAGYPVRRVSLTWVSDAAGAVSGTLSRLISGTLVKVVFVPGAGALAPTAAYDVTLLDEFGLDVLAGQGANLSETTTTATCPGVPLKDGTTTSVVPVQVNDQLEIRVANAGDSNGGAVHLFIR